MLVKVCGLNNPDNIIEIDSVNPDFVGLIFYKKSPRCVTGLYPTTRAKRVGVFVNEPIDDIIEMKKKYSLDYIQLHGGESKEFCTEIKSRLSGTGIIKVFPVYDKSDFNICDEYKDVCDYFLFDTKTDNHGGSGKHFDWSILDSYNLNKPFFLSGGISLRDIEGIKGLHHPQLKGVDINSCFEQTPGLKNVNKVKFFIDNLRYNR